MRLAADEGLRALAVTDHDTTDGLAEAREEASRRGIELVNGMELSVRWPDGTFHLLGYLFEEGPGLAEGLARLQALRRERNERMLAKLNGLGHALTMDDVRAQSGGGQIGRPHMAKALVAKGVVASVQEAFEKLLRRGAPAYAMVERLTEAEAIGIVKRAGGAAVLAHPYQLRLKPEGLDARLAEWKAAGLDGIEVQHSSHDPERQRVLEELAARHGLAGTGGSDYHGDTKPDVRLGTAWGGQRIRYERLEALKARVRSQRREF